MKHHLTKSTKCFTGLTLANGVSWDIIPFDHKACVVVLALARLMRLKDLTQKIKVKSKYRNLKRLFVSVDDPQYHPHTLSKTIHLTSLRDDTIYCTMIPDEKDKMLLWPLLHLSMVICQDAQNRGGVLLHGALAELNGSCVILAGPGGRGKTSASKRLPHYWNSLCDDTTLVVRDNGGAFWAHPWPTWSTFAFSGFKNTWDVQHSIPLKGIFFLDQAHEIVYRPLGVAQNVCMLNASAEQVSWLMPGYTEKNKLQEIRLQRFNNICTLAQTIPSYILRLDRNGAFWQAIERALDD